MRTYKTTCQAQIAQDKRKHHLYYSICSLLQFDMANQLCLQAPTQVSCSEHKSLSPSEEKLQNMYRDLVILKDEL